MLYYIIIYIIYIYIYNILFIYVYMYVFFMNDENFSPLGLISPKQVENYYIL